jgi:hypothetical protein
MTEPIDHRLLGYLREQVEFLRASAASYDAGFEGEARRLATTIRVLVHDTKSSHSLLGQMGLKDRIRWTDTSLEPDPPWVASHGGLAMTVLSPGGSRYLPVLDRLSERRIREPVAFDEWWTKEIVSDEHGDALTRRRFVLTTANETGGAHVDPKLNVAYERLVASSSYPGVESSTPRSEMGDIALANVRQIAWETEQTLTREVPDLLFQA